LRSRPASTSRLFSASGTPNTVKPTPLLATTSAASGVTPSKACCQAAEACGVTTRAVQRWSKHPKVAVMFEEVRNARLDLAESTIIQAIKNRNITAAIFYLKCHGKTRGWVERREITGADGGPLTHDAYARQEVERVKLLMADPTYASRACELIEIADRVERPAGALGPGVDGEVESGGIGEIRD